MHRLQQAQRGLLADDKTQFTLFNQAYLCILARYHEGVRNRIFDRVYAMERLSENFANFYFDAISSRPKVTTKAWELLRKNRSLAQQPIKVLAMGANTHINHDLPLALLSSDMGDKDDADYRAFSIVIRGTTKDTVALLQDRLLGGRFAPVRKVYTLAIYQLVEYWRRRAWKNFKKLKQGKLSPEKLNKASENYALWIKTNIFFGIIRTLV